MLRPRYDTTQHWYKGNTHIHSCASDARATPEEIGELYAGLGYDFLCLTDHGVMSDVSTIADPPLLWIDGVELAGRPPATPRFYEAVCLGRFPEIVDMPFPAAMEHVTANGGVVILSHPYFIDLSFDDCTRYAVHGVEAYNLVADYAVGKGLSTAHWDRMLTKDPNTLGFAVDDSHYKTHHTWDGGWIVVNAPELTMETMLCAIKAGNFYSTRGPEIHAIEYDGDKVTVRMSPVRYARLVGPSYYHKPAVWGIPEEHQDTPQGAKDGELITEATFAPSYRWSQIVSGLRETMGQPYNTEEPVVRIEIEDDHGRVAWSNPLYVY